MQLAEGFPLIYEGTLFAKHGYWWETTRKSDLGCPTWHGGQWQEQIQLCAADRMIMKGEKKMSELINATHQ